MEVSALTGRFSCGPLGNRPDKTAVPQNLVGRALNKPSETTLHCAVVRSVPLPTNSVPLPVSADSFSASPPIRSAISRRSAERELSRLSGSGKPVILLRHHPLIRIRPALAPAFRRMSGGCPSAMPPQSRGFVRAASGGRPDNARWSVRAIAGHWPGSFRPIGGQRP